VIAFAYNSSTQGRQEDHKLKASLSYIVTHFKYAGEKSASSINGTGKTG
jgi:hypothetical protein